MTAVIVTLVILVGIVVLVTLTRRPRTTRPTDWFHSTDRLDIRALPDRGLSIGPSASDSATYPVVVEGVFCHPSVTRTQREAELSWHVGRRAREKGAPTVFVSEPHYREISQTFGEPHPLAIDGVLHQAYCYVAYIVPTQEAA